MNEPIISPWIFYVCGLCESAGTLLTVALILSGIGLVIFGGIAFVDGISDKLDKVKKFIAIWFVVGLIASVIPSRTVIIQMIIAQNITKANVEKVGKYADIGIEKLIDKIIEASEKLEKGKK